MQDINEVIPQMEELICVMLNSAIFNVSPIDK
jgi:hypothetical protein